VSGISRSKYGGEGNRERRDARREIGEELARGLRRCIELSRSACGRHREDDGIRVLCGGGNRSDCSPVSYVRR